MCGTYLDVSAASELRPAAAVTRMQVNDRLQSARQQIDTLPCAVQRTAAHAKHASIDLNFSCRYILKKKKIASPIGLRLSSIRYVRLYRKEMVATEKVRMKK